MDNKGISSLLNGFWIILVYIVIIIIYLKNFNFIFTNINKIINFFLLKIKIFYKNLFNN